MPTCRQLDTDVGMLSCGQGSSLSRFYDDPALE